MMLRNNNLPAALSSTPATNVAPAPYGDTAAAVTTGRNIDASTTVKTRIKPSHPKPRPAAHTPKASGVPKDVPTVQPKSEPGHGRRAAGQQKGAQNFSKEDITELLRLVQETLPTGNQGWESIQKEYSQYAEKANRNKRNTENLRQKFNRVSLTLYLSSKIATDNNTTAGK